jgi:hypothetical protein
MKERIEEKKITKVTFSAVLVIIILIMSAALFAVSAWVVITGESIVIFSTSTGSGVTVKSANIDATWEISYEPAKNFGHFWSFEHKDGKKYAAPGVAINATVEITGNNNTRIFVYEIDLGLDNDSKILDEDGKAIGTAQFPAGDKNVSKGKYYGVIEKAGDTDTVIIKLRFSHNLTNKAQNKKFFENITVICCQATEQAVIDVFGQEAYDIVKDLLKEVPEP